MNFDKNIFLILLLGCVFVYYYSTSKNTNNVINNENYIEIIVVDDGSTDGSSIKLKEIKEKKDYNFLFKLIKKHIKKGMVLNNSDNRYSDTEWGFPKGRRNNNEKDIECANREFYEETNYKNNEYQILIKQYLLFL